MIAGVPPIPPSSARPPLPPEGDQILPAGMDPPHPGAEGGGWVVPGEAQDSSTTRFKHPLSPLTVVIGTPKLPLKQ